MTDYQKYINALRKCAKEHKNDRTSIGHIIVSDLCRDTANLLEELEQESCEDAISRQAVLNEMEIRRANGDMITAGFIKGLPPVTPQPKTGHWIEGKYKDDDIRYNNSSYKCDKCGRIVDFKENYCPDCGCRMVDPQERSVKE